MNEIIMEGKSVEEAIEKGLSQLGGVNRNAVDMEVLDEGKQGLFGLGGREARVRLVLKQELPGTQTETRPVSMDKSTGATDENEQTGGDPEELAKEIITEILKRMDIEAEIRSSREENEILISIDGAGGQLIGRRGQTLFSLQYLINRIVGRETGSDEMIIVDVEGYRNRREKEMTEMAERLYRQVQESGRSVTVKNLSAHDRRIVHLTLKDRQAVETYSRGNGHLRRLVIAPKGQGRRPENERRRPGKNRKSGGGGGDPKRDSNSTATANNRIKVFTKRFTDSSSGSYSEDS